MLAKCRLSILLIITFLAFYFCSDNNSTTPPIIEPEDEPPVVVNPILPTPVSIDSLVKTVSDLTGENSVNINGIQKYIKSRQYNHEGNEDAAIYLTNRLEKYGLDVKIQDFYHSKSEYDSSQGKNILGIKKGKQEDIYFIISAHYDSYSSIGLMPTGADDNGSGCGVVIEAARILSKLETEYSIIFALWDEEELGWVGSTVYADSVYLAGMNIKYVIDLDMVAWDGDNDSKVRLEFYKPGKYGLSIIRLADSLNVADSLGLDFIKSNSSCGSDACSFASWCETLGVSEYWGSDNITDRNYYYHSTDDRVTTFNLRYYERISELIIKLLAVASKQ